MRGALIALALLIILDAVTTLYGVSLDSHYEQNSLIGSHIIPAALLTLAFVALLFAASQRLKRTHWKRWLSAAIWCLVIERAAAVGTAVLWLHQKVA